MFRALAKGWLNPAHAGRIAAELALISEKAILHEKGNFVLEKIIDAGDALEIMAILKPLCSKPYDFAHHKYAVMKFAKAVDKLVSLLCVFAMACGVLDRRQQQLIVIGFGKDTQYKILKLGDSRDKNPQDKD